MCTAPAHRPSPQWHDIFTQARHNLHPVRSRFLSNIRVTDASRNRRMTQCDSCDTHVQPLLSLHRDPFVFVQSHKNTRGHRHLQMFIWTHTHTGVHLVVCSYLRSICRVPQTQTNALFEGCQPHEMSRLLMLLRDIKQ